MNQEKSEFVLLLQNAAQLEFEDESSAGVRYRELDESSLYSLLG